DLWSCASPAIAVDERDTGSGRQRDRKQRVDATDLRGDGCTRHLPREGGREVEDGIQLVATRHFLDDHRWRAGHAGDDDLVTIVEQAGRDNLHRAIVVDRLDGDELPYVGIATTPGAEHRRADAEILD